MEGLVPNPKVRDRIAKLCVGLAAPADPPDQELWVDTVMRANLPKATLVPWAGFVTHDLKWIGGFSGRCDLDAFAALLDTAESSPLLDATPEVVKKLTDLAVQAEQAAEKAQWSRTVAAAKSAAELKGRTPVRDRLAVVVAKAHAWADEEMAKTLDLVKSGGDRTAARVALKKVSAAFAGEPEASEADAGVKAIDKLAVIETLAEDKVDAAREKAAKDFEGTRWKALFERATIKWK